MRRTFIIAVLCIICQLAFAQKKEWKELDSFHDVMSATFHPAEEGNLKPLQQKSFQLLEKAKQWKAAAVPVGYDAASLKPLLKKLVNEADEINKLVKRKAADNVLKDKITAMHTTFHQIVEQCREH